MQLIIQTNLFFIKQNTLFAIRRFTHFVLFLVCCDFHQLGPELGRVGLVVDMSVCLSVCVSDVPFPCDFHQLVF